MGLQNIREDSFEEAFELSAQYNRNSEYYCQRYNVTDCYEQYLDDVHDDLKVLWSTGHSYCLKGEYIFCMDVKEFRNDYPDVYRHFMGYVIAAFDRYVDREKGDVLYIPMIVPTTEHINKVTYKLVDQVAHKYVKKGYVVITDAPLRRDFEIFGNHTDSNPVNINGMQYYVWR